MIPNQQPGASQSSKMPSSRKASSFSEGFKTTILKQLKEGNTPNLIKSKELCNEIRNCQTEQALWIILQSIAHEKLPLNPYLFTQIIKKCSRLRQLDDALKFFRCAQETENANNFVHNSLIDAAGKKGDLALAKQTFEAAQKAQLVNAVSYASLIDAAGKKGDLALAKQTFEAAQKAQLADAVSYANFLDILFEKGETEQAKRLFQESAIELCTCRTRNVVRIDLHGFSKSTAYFALERYFNNSKTCSSDMRYQLIVGRGLHSQVTNDVQEHPVLQGVKLFLEGVVPAGGQYTKDPENTGQINLSFSGGRPSPKSSRQWRSPAVVSKTAQLTYR